MRFATFGFSAHVQKISEIYQTVRLSRTGVKITEGAGIVWRDGGKWDTCHVVIDGTIRVSALCIYVMSTNRFSTGDIYTVSSVHMGPGQICPNFSVSALALAGAQEILVADSKASKDISFVFTFPKSRSETCVA